MASADAAVLSALETYLLHPRVLELAIRRAVDQLAAPSTPSAAVDEELETVEQELRRLGDAVAAGGHVPTLVAAIRAREARRQELRAARPVPQLAHTFSADAILADLRGRLEDWRSLLHDEAPKARALLKQLIVGRLDMTPHRDDRTYSFRGTRTVMPVLEGLVPQSVASPPGFAPFSVTGSWRRAA